MEKSKNRIRNLVKQLPFSPIANYAQKGAEGNSMQSKLEYFAENCARCVAIPGLSAPSISGDGMLSRVLNSLHLAFVGNRDLLGRSFVIVDGTPYDEVSEENHYGRDVFSVSVIWKSREVMTVGVVMGVRRFVKAHTQYHIQNNMWRRSLFFDVRINSPVETWLKEAEGFAKFTPVQIEQWFGPILDRAIAVCKSPQLEYPVAAATYLGGVVWYVPRPKRHFHVEHSTEYQAWKRQNNPRRGIQGFLTNHGNFMARNRSMFKAMNITCMLKTEGVPVQIGVTRVLHRHQDPLELQMSGIIEPADLSPEGFRIAAIPLFSEDLW